MTQYRSSNHSHRQLVEQWYWDLRDSHEFITTFHHSFALPQSFIEHFEKGNLLFTNKGPHMISALWFYPWFDGVEMGVWIERNHRNSPSVIKEVKETFEQTLHAFPVVVSYTIQERIGKPLKHLGFVHTGSIPFAWDGQTVEAFYITKELYDVKQK